MTLLLELAPASLQSYAFNVKFPDEEVRMTQQNITPTLQKMAKSLTDTCMVWAKDAPTQKKIEEGDFKYLIPKLYPEFAKKKK